MPFPRSGPLVAWGTAYLLGRASLDEADVHTVADDVVHRVVGVPGLLDLACTVDVGLFERGNQDAQAGIVESCHYGVVTEIELG